MQPTRIIAILLVCLALSPLAPAQAEPVKINPPFDVNTTGDGGDDNQGDCICRTISAPSFCTLRAAIQESNACAGDNDILLNNGVTYVIGSALTVHPASESPTEVINLDTDNNEGAKAIIKGSGDENYLAFSSGIGTLNITNITISDSNGISVALDATLNLNKVLMTNNHGNTGPSGDERGGGGALSNSYAVVSVYNSQFIGNISQGCGGAINNSGHLTVDLSLFNSNSAVHGGAICHVGFRWPEAPYETWNISINRSEFGANLAGGNGGALFIAGPSFTGDLNLIQNSLFTGNDAWYGGGIYVGPAVTDQIGGGLVLLASTISENTALHGAGLAIGNSANLLSRYTVYVENSTISGNLALKHGGGVYLGPVLEVPANPTVAISSSTITNNTADSSGIEATNGGGIYNLSTSKSVRLENTILANNLDASTGTFALKMHDCYGDINLEGYNLIGRSGGCILDSDGTSLIGDSSAPIDPFLKPLDQDGYAIPTHGLLYNSPALNRGDPTGCKNPDGIAITSDQRGENRPYGSACDIGSVEAQFSVRKIFLPTILR